jgi:hypothetical protein
MMVFLPRWQPGSLRSDAPCSRGLRVIRAMLMGTVAASLERLGRPRWHGNRRLGQARAPALASALRHGQELASGCPCGDLWVYRTRAEHTTSVVQDLTESRHAA